MRKKLKNMGKKGRGEGEITYYIARVRDETG
jgi:hypothetical protein